MIANNMIMDILFFIGLFTFMGISFSYVPQIINPGNFNLSY
jgi:hypothetical protein